MSSSILIVLIIVGVVAAIVTAAFLINARGGVQSESGRVLQWTIVMAIASWFGVATAIWSVWQLRVDLREVVSATISLELDKEFDSSEMRRARRALATELLRGKGDLFETRVLDFFEKVGTYQRLDRVDTYTVDSSFSYFVERYWIASQGYVANFRKMQNDNTYFKDFERLNADMLDREAKEKHRQRFQVTPAQSEVERFLREEAVLP